MANNRHFEGSNAYCTRKSTSLAPRVIDAMYFCGGDNWVAKFYHAKPVKTPFERWLLPSPIADGNYIVPSTDAQKTRNALLYRGKKNG